jgi:peptide deformylase
VHSKALTTSRLGHLVFVCNGLGLSGIQVNVLKRLVVMVSLKECNSFINTTIIYQSRTINEECEGCLSIPGIFKPTVRFLCTGVRCFSCHIYIPSFCLVFIKSFHLFSACVRHESDHCNGLTVLYLEVLRV